MFLLLHAACVHCCVVGLLIVAPIVVGKTKKTGFLYVPILLSFLLSSSSAGGRDEKKKRDKQESRR